MPCQSYESSWANGNSDADVRRLKKEADKLARIACAALTELEKVGKAEFLVLKNDELREWWEAHKEADRREQARIAEQERRKKVKEDALARLTDEEKEVLGFKKPKKHKVVLQDYDPTDYADAILSALKTYEDWDRT